MSSPGPQRRVADALRHAATVIEEAPWGLGPSQRVSVDFAPNANETEVAIHGCDEYLLRAVADRYSDRASVRHIGESVLAPIRSVEFQHDGLTVVFYRR